MEDYLTGKTDSSANISLEVLDEELAGAATEQAGVEQAGAAAAPGDDAGGVMEAMLRRVGTNELRLRDRNSMLLVPGHSFDKVLVLFNSALADAQRAQPAAPPPAKPAKVGNGGGQARGRAVREHASGTPAPAFALPCSCATHACIHARARP